MDGQDLGRIAVDRLALDRLAVDRKQMDGEPLDDIGLVGVALDRQPVDGVALDLRCMGVTELGLSALPRRSAARLERRVVDVIAVQVTLAVTFAVLATSRGEAIGSPAAILALTASFVVAGAFDMSLELHRHKFTFTPADAVLVVGFFIAGPVGLAAAFAVAEAVNGIAQRRGPLKVLFNVANRLAAVTIAAVVFQAFGRTSPHDMGAWMAALVAVMCFSLLDVVATAVVISMVEDMSFQHVFVRSASTGMLATLAAAPIGLVALDLFTRSPLAVLLLVPLAIAVGLNSRDAVGQRDEHLRFERLYESSARTAELHALDDALRSLAGEARALATGVVALCCATDIDGASVGAWADDRGQRLAAAGEIAAAIDFAERFPGRETNADTAAEIDRMVAGAGSALAVSSVHAKAGRVVLVVFRDGPSNAGADSRVETVAAFASHASLIVANAMMHEALTSALAVQVDLNRRKADFIGAVSHELRTPLAVMLGSVHTLNRLDGRMPPEQRTQLFDMTVDQGGRLQRLIDELLLVAAVEHANVPLERDTVDIAELFDSIEADTAAATSGRLVGSFGDRAEVVTDRSKLARVLLNLVENAAKYAPCGPIELRATRAGGDVFFRVIDHGPGIPAEDRERAFEQFVQLDQSSTRRQGGTGLGLHLCRQLAELLGGRLTLTATPGGGCTFSLSLPWAPTTMAPTPPKPEADEVFPGVRGRPADDEVFPGVRGRPADGEVFPGVRGRPAALAARD
jgi:signal transduction histidine kinase